jgi:hypothetical protein
MLAVWEEEQGVSETAAQFAFIVATPASWIFSIVEQVVQQEESLDFPSSLS